MSQDYLSEQPPLLVRDPRAMDALGEQIAKTLIPGVLVLLTGTLGAGKSHLARAIIRTLCNDDTLEVASPTYTLVNVYAANGREIWHADLYRLSDPEELQEIGLSDAIGSATVLVEWPEQLVDLPETRMEIDIQIPEQEGRLVHLRTHGEQPALMATELGAAR